ncbi:hypothetical protein AGABI1DRAFT_122919 [Agaricus bisporus var. burnettii JB137-S8]|uniref:Uncharacterized protein n=1 Tax=Agaricus bisporus var. burnettii (strain JB137-S8 / ATCC MYA-4627 / FGSC 10392) TaxID=597362 RepID=K5WL69_AGABU|nr:uncharacterized protein AGABI1DRAFT_122919 [Agaricus bisporus var. burnettii JB137-S8]EKM76051.1 hypothetical protein AGABI1DRAFT_122919 [Agaricus bisporus var. burnettii JB137-S8]
MELPLRDPYSESNARLSYRDVAEVRHMFLFKLPYELVDIILEEAQCWAYTSTECYSFHSIRASSSPSFNASHIILISEPIPDCSKVKTIQFRIHSQEFKTGYFTGRFRNPYDSYTWFEASILRPLDLPQPLPQSAMSTNHSLNANKLMELGWMEIANPRDGRNRRWPVQANATSAPSKLHHVTWGSMDDAGKTLFDDEWDSETGQGPGLGFIETLRAGDRIILLGRALFAGYENHVFSTKIEIACQT